MERVETLCEKLKDQINESASIDELLMTVQMLQSELQHLKSNTDDHYNQSVVAFDIPSVFEDNNSNKSDREYLQLDINDADIEEELEQMKKIAQAKNNISLKNRKSFRFDPIEDTPTLSFQTKETKVVIGEVVVEEDSLNDKLRENVTEISDTLKDSPRKDLKNAIGINDRFLFINELFKGDETMYERSIKTINSFSIYPEAEFWIRRELKIKLSWEDMHEVVKQFDQLVKRRFS